MDSLSGSGFQNRRGAWVTSQERLIRARLGILAMAAELKNVTRACKLAGLSRSQFYVMRKAYELYGEKGLALRVRRKPLMPNRTPDKIEAQILLKTHANPSFSYVRLAAHMKAEGIAVTPTMIRYVWQRHGLSTRAARLQSVKRRQKQPESLKLNGTANRSLDAGPAASVTAIATTSSSPPPLASAV